MRRLVFSLLVCFTLVGTLTATNEISYERLEIVNLDEIELVELLEQYICTESVTGTVDAYIVKYNVKCEGTGTGATPQEACRKAHAVVKACLDNWGL